MDWDCADCGENTELEYYMVHDHLWDEHGVGDGLLCIGCLEDRIGRELGKNDFTDCILNIEVMGWEKSERLMERLAA